MVQFAYHSLRIGITLNVNQYQSRLILAETVYSIFLADLQV